MDKVRIISSDGCYEIFTPYDYDFVTDLKALIPYGQRVYNRDRHSWTVGGKHGLVIQDLCQKYFGERPALPKSGQAVASPTLGMLKVLYIGKAKNRKDGSRSAYGWMQLSSALLGSWSVIFPEKVLRNYFEPATGEERAAAPEGNYFQILGIKVGADESEVKTAYRRMVKQWHPDVCKDPDAHEIFIRIQRAYEILANPGTKARYEAGLRFEALVPQVRRSATLPAEEEYRAPLKCGLILCEYFKIGEKYIVEKIHSWDDICNSAGQTLVSSWEMGKEEPTLIWN